jgi:geranylgeranyl diphosphate synthase type II
VLGEIRSLVAAKRSPLGPVLYDLMLDYPLRDAKALRPALCIACCRALGGRLDAVLPSAAVLEFYHNAFLIHDDIEDGSHTRRGSSTLHVAHGIPVAINVGDAMLALSLRPLLNNTRTIGLGKALRVLEAISTMAEVSVEGQAMELDWIARREWNLADSDYLSMVEKKTAWYSFVAPLQVAVAVAGGDQTVAERVVEFGRALGLAFQIQDDVLNLELSSERYGKEPCGDVWEGKRTLILLHMLRVASPEERQKAQSILSKRRPLPDRPPTEEDKTEAEVEVIRGLIDKHSSLAYARQVARALAEAARQHALSLRDWMPPSAHRDFIDSLVEYVHLRDH